MQPRGNEIMAAWPMGRPRRGATLALLIATLLSGTAPVVLAPVAARAAEVAGSAPATPPEAVPGQGTAQGSAPAPTQSPVAQAPAAETQPPAPGIPATSVAALPSTAPIVLPVPPDATVVIKAGDVVAAALAARLADPMALPGSRLPRRQREAVAAFYALGAFKPLWIEDGAWSAAAKSVVARLATAGEDGLEAGDYPVPSPSAADKAASPADLAQADLALTAAVVRYVRDARGGRLDLPRLSTLITPKLDLPEPDAVLTRLAGAGTGAGTALASYNPDQPGYRALRAKLAQMRAAAPPIAKPPLGEPMVGLPPRPGRREAAVAAPRLEAEVLSNMERWRWLPSDLGRDYVMVNIPAYQVRVVTDGRVVHEARVVVGKADTPTPVFSGTMEYAVVNPSWNVPPSILKNEFLPGLARDPLYAAKRGYEVVRRGNTIAVRQPPGERNALGFIKFMFPNQHAVYLHDTPSRALFSSARRAFSHGCVRVDQPFEFAQYVLGPKWSSERLRKLVGKGERTVQLPEKLPVHLAYFTVVVDEAGTLRRLDDIYGYDARVRAALGLEGAAARAAALAKPPIGVVAKPVRAAAVPAPRPVHQAVHRAPRPEQAAQAPQAVPAPEPRGLFDSFWR